MSVDVCVPPLGESVLEAVVGKWHVSPGMYVKKNALLVEVETDKVTLEINAISDGWMESISAPSGKTVASGEVLGKLSHAQPEGAVAAPPEPVYVKEEPIPLPTPPAKVKDQPPAKPQPILKPLIASGQTTRQPMSRLRKRIAERLKDAQNTAAILTTFNEVDLSALTQLRQKFQTSFTEKYGVKLGWMSLFTQAAVRALQMFPNLNSRIEGEDIVTSGSINIGVAVATPYGLVVPVMKGVERLSLGEIEQHITDMARRGRDKELSPSDLTDGTFTITNGGTFGSLLSTPILNPPQSGILGMHTIQERPVVVQGQIVIRPMMYLALSYDHRLIDGQEAVSFLVSIKNTLENPGVIWLGL